MVLTDIQISRNHFFKPLTWMKGTPEFIGMVAIVNNDLELKNAQRVLVDGNAMETPGAASRKQVFPSLSLPRIRIAAAATYAPYAR